MALTEIQVRTYEILAKARGGYVPLNDMIAHVWPEDKEPDHARNHLCRTMKSLKKNLERSGVLVEFRNKQGYRGTSMYALIHP